ncbi:hypothetical protein PsAD37_03432 [Pseudovibrio sp. Ad37]|nr:hypothetical protein PsAD37_03432 [Pseudovibrio sp. Ad37]
MCKIAINRVYFDVQITFKIITVSGYSKLLYIHSIIRDSDFQPHSFEDVMKFFKGVVQQVDS